MEGVQTAGSGSAQHVYQTNEWIHLYCPPLSACHTDYLSDNNADMDAIRFVSETNPTTIDVCSCRRAGSADGNG